MEHSYFDILIVFIVEFELITSRVDFVFPSRYFIILRLNTTRFKKLMAILAEWRKY